MQFYNSEYLNALWITAILAFIYLLSAKLRRKKIATFGVPSTVHKMSNFSSKNWRIRTLAILAAVVFAVLALSRPQWGMEKKKIERKGVDILFLLDTSLSMLSQDTKPSRMEKAKLEIKSFVKKMKGDRIGLVAFAGSSFLQCPLTLDYSAFFLFLDAINVGYIPDPGSSLSEAIANAFRAFPSGDKKHRVIIIFSDGEFFEENLQETSKKARQEGITIYCIGLGTKEGEPIPLKAEGGKVVAYKKDSSGKVVITKLEEGSLISIAQDTGGLYYPATPHEQEIDLIYRDMQKLGKKRLKSQLATEKEDHYQLFLGAAVILLLLSLLLRERKREGKPL